MPYDRQHLRIQWLFEDLSSDEIALTGLNYSVIPAWSGAAAAMGEADIVGSVGAALTARMSTMLAVVDFRWADYSQLNGVKVSAVGTDGKILTDPKIHADSTPANGTTANVSPQETIVCSLRSGTSIGTANYGRMFLPHTRFNYPAGTSSANATATQICNAAFKVFVNGVTSDLNAALADTVQPFIMSNFDPIRASKPVLRTRVGNVVDTQRRRRNNIPEIYNELVL